MFMTKSSSSTPTPQSIVVVSEIGSKVAVSSPMKSGATLSSKIGCSNVLLPRNLVSSEFSNRSVTE